MIYFLHANKTHLLFSLLVSNLILCGCSQDDLQVPETRKISDSSSDITTQTMVAVTKCVDAYVEVGGYMYYKDTRCHTEWVEGGGGGLNEGEYYPGEFPSSGSQNAGDNGWQPGTTQNFTYEDLKEFYQAGSTPNLEFKSKLNEAIKRFYQQGEIYEKVYNLMVQSHVKIKFILKPEIKDPYYDRLTKSIYLKDEDSFSVFKFSEEMLHAAQHQCFYDNLMDMNYKNYEFEVKVFYDLAHQFYICAYPAIDYLPTYTDTREEFRDAYISWIENNIYAIRFFPPAQIMEFNYLCGMWEGYKGSNLPSFKPLLIQRFFNKPIPDHM